MPKNRRGVSIPEPKWQEILRLLKLRPFLAQTPSGFILKAIDNEIERVWREFKLTPEGGPHPAASGGSGQRGRARDAEVDAFLAWLVSHPEEVRRLKAAMQRSTGAADGRDSSR